MRRSERKAMGRSKNQYQGLPWLDGCSASGGPRCEQGLATLAHTGAQRENHQGTALDPLKVETRKGGRAFLAQCSGTQPRQGLRRSPCLCRAKGYCWGFELVPEEERYIWGPRRPEGDGAILPIWTKVATGRKAQGRGGISRP